MFHSSAENRRSLNLRKTIIPVYALLRDHVFQKHRSVFTDAFLSFQLVDVSQLFNQLDSEHVQILCQGELIKIRRIIIERQLKQNYIKLSIPLQQWLFFFMNGCTSFNAAFCKIVCDGNGFILHLSFRR